MPSKLNDAINELVENFADKALQGGSWVEMQKSFVPGLTPITPSGAVIGKPEITNLIKVSLQQMYTEGRWVDDFEAALQSFFKLRCASLCNSGSSANLLAVSALTSPKLDGHNLKPGDEVITLACGFPTTVNAIIQNRLVPVFVDVELDTLVPLANKIKRAITSKTRAIVMAHTLGNPLPMMEILDLVKGRDIFVVEDNCDSMGSYHRDFLTGTFGHLSTLSFYPAHHITTGEGGAVLTNSPRFQKIVESFRDWGRDCWCVPGDENTCGKRFDWWQDFPSLPYGYDHKYIYSHVGYNLKGTNFQAAIGLAQLHRFDYFRQARRKNFRYALAALRDLEEYFILPRASAGSDPNWFGFPLTIRKGAGFTRKELVERLNARKIGTRMVFGGNLLRQPAYQGMGFDNYYLPNSDYIAENTFWLGIWPGVTEMMLDFISDEIHSFVRDR